MHFLLGLGLLILGIWILSKRAAYPYHVDVSPCETNSTQVLELRAEVERLKLELVQEKLKHFRYLESRCDRNDLDQHVLQDALNREIRAKAALRALLQGFGYQESDIEKVINTVDGEEI